jgi:hypothetical protein
VLIPGSVPRAAPSLPGWASGNTDRSDLLVGRPARKDFFFQKRNMLPLADAASPIRVNIKASR